MTKRGLGEWEGCLLIRVWTEPDGPGVLRARVLSVRGDAEPVSVATIASEEAVLAVVGEWVRAQLPAATGAVGR